MTSRSRNINNEVNENLGSRRIEHLFFVSRKIILQNHASRLPWKSRFTRKNLAISRFTRKYKGRSRFTKIPFTTLYSDARFRKTFLVLRQPSGLFFAAFEFNAICNAAMFLILLVSLLVTFNAHTPYRRILLVVSSWSPRNSSREGNPAKIHKYNL